MSDSNGNGSAPPMRAFAGELLAAGMCVVPANDRKHPSLAFWKDFQQGLPVADELDEWFCDAHPYGLGFVCGEVSGGLEVLDLDAKHDPTGTLNVRAELAIKEFAPGLWEKMVIEKTPTNGRHLYFRCKEPAGNLKLAYSINHEGKRMAVAETRGKGGFIMAAPSPGYVLIQGELTRPPIISDDERSALFAAARSLDTAPVAEPIPEKPVNTRARTDFPANGELRPGDAYNLSDRWMDELKAIGWTTRDDKHWTRPGKALADGNSANWDTMSDHPRHFHVFTPNAAPFDDGKTYTPFSIYALLKCGGDLSRAARELADQGFGSRARSQSISERQPTIDTNREIGGEDQKTPESMMGPNGEIIKPSVKPPTDEERRVEVLKKLRQSCLARAFNFAVIPPKPIPRLTIKGNVVSSAGNLTNIIAQSKACKSTLQEAMIASIIAADIGTAPDCDCLGISATAPKGMNVIHFDTEQSLYDHDSLIRRAIRRARADKAPDWLHSFCLTGFPIPDCRKLVHLMMQDMLAKGGVFAVFIDGVGDLAVNVNDPEECNPLVAELHAAAIQFNCSIISNIHENPGQDFGKGRGHLGSQLERKAESNLRLKKTGDTITLFSEKMRRGSILEKDGPTFSWDNAAMMHLSCANKGDARENAKRDKLENLIDAAFTHCGKKSLRYAEFIKILSEVAHISTDHASTRFTEFKKAGLIAQDIVGGWSKVVRQG